MLTVSSYWCSDVIFLIFIFYVIVSCFGFYCFWVIFFSFCQSSSDCYTYMYRRNQLLEFGSVAKTWSTCVSCHILQSFTLLPDPDSFSPLPSHVFLFSAPISTADCYVWFVSNKLLNYPLRKQRHLLFFTSFCTAENWCRYYFSACCDWQYRLSFTDCFLSYSVFFCCLLFVFYNRNCLWCTWCTMTI